MKRNGFVSVSILITMLLILTIATMGINSTSGLRKTYKHSVKVKENYLVGENFTTYYQVFMAEKIKQKFKSMPYEEKHSKIRDDLDKMNAAFLNYCYSALDSNWGTEFVYALKSEDTNSYLGKSLFKCLISKQYYNTVSKKYETYYKTVNNSDFRTIVMMQVDDEKGTRIQLDTQVYFYLPSYTNEQLEKWLVDDEFFVDEEDFEFNKITRVGDTVAFG